MKATPWIEKLLVFASEKGLLANEDIYFARNMLLSAMGMEAPDDTIADATMSEVPATATVILDALSTIAASQGIIDDSVFAREQFSAHLMNLLTPLPSQVIATFRALARDGGTEAATDWFYALCRANDYIRVDQIAKNVEYAYPSPVGELEITINLSKPEKDPKEIAKAKNLPSTGYPPCMLCPQNEGYAGRANYPSHESMRIIPIDMNGEAWGLQYSPYSYYPEHCIALNMKHTEMSVSRRSFSLLTSFVDQFPHYFIGSNADLPIVGGSILSHDHFQGGRHVFPLDKAPAYAGFHHDGYADVRIEAVNWPMTTLRITSASKAQIIDLSNHILQAWRPYDDLSREITHATDGRSHNTITPILRKNQAGEYVMQLVLRNNRTSNEHPLGIFHPHADLHHVKKENIGLIEVMGLFILPGRLLAELDGLTGYLTGAKEMQRPADDDPLAKHYDWVATIRDEVPSPLSKDDALQTLRGEVGKKCVRVLEDSGVFKLTHDGRKGLALFLSSVGIREV